MCELYQCDIYISNILIGLHDKMPIGSNVIIVSSLVFNFSFNRCIALWLLPVKVFQSGRKHSNLPIKPFLTPFRIHTKLGHFSSIIKIPNKQYYWAWLDRLDVEIKDRPNFMLCGNVILIFSQIHNFKFRIYINLRLCNLKSIN